LLPTLRLALILATITASSVSGQLPAADSASQDSVTAFAIRGGRLALSSLANPGRVYLPSGTYKNQSDLIIAIVDGKITRIQETTDQITEISSSRVNRQKMIALMPSTNALMAVQELILPSGTFTSEDGSSSITIVSGRPTAFTVARRNQ
jgi:hypothetical protein